MRVEMRTQAVRFAMLAGLALVLSGCDSIRDAAGITKDAPDEFAVVTKAPLVVPPDFNLRPPKPGVPPTNQVSPTDSAQNALFPDDPSAAAATISGNYSQGEKLLLATAGAASADDSIRQVIAADQKNMDAADESFTNQVLFGAASNADQGLNADAEKARLDHDQRTGRVSADADTTAPMPASEPAPASMPDPGQAPADQDMSGAAPAADTGADVNPPDDGSTAGTLPPLDGSGATPSQPAQPRHTKPAKKDSDGWFDGIF
jgi:hypothetical protein